MDATALWISILLIGILSIGFKYFDPTPRISVVKVLAGYSMERSRFNFRHGRGIRCHLK
jgi:hypothetical protein